MTDARWSRLLGKPARFGVRSLRRTGTLDEVRAEIEAALGVQLVPDDTDNDPLLTCSMPASQLRLNAWVSPDKEGFTKEGMPYLQGIQANLVIRDHKWITDARAAEMPLKAGISGTTHRFLKLGELLGIGGKDKFGMRLAMMGHLQAIEAHSFWEICDAAGMGPERGKYLPFEPVSPASMESAAKETLGHDPEMAKNVTGQTDLAAQVKRLLGTDKG